MQYTIKAVETKYNHVVFRSRLEAKWAAMFDLLGWQWTYEPTDFNGWLPDFAIWGKTTVYVEVKPTVEFPHDVADKIESSGCYDEVLILGIRGPILADGLGFENPDFGWLCDRCDDYVWGRAVLGRWREGENGQIYNDNKIGFCHSSQAFTDRITGRYDGGTYGMGDMRCSEAEMLWREAGNRVQWKPK